MKEYKDAMINLLKVKSIVTILMTVLFGYQIITGTITDDFMTIYLIVISFYFGTQTQKNANNKEE